MEVIKKFFYCFTRAKEVFNFKIQGFLISFIVIFKKNISNYFNVHLKTNDDFLSKNFYCLDNQKIF